MANKEIKKLEVLLTNEHMIMQNGGRFEVRPSDAVSKEIAEKFAVSTVMLKNAWSVKLSVELALCISEHLPTRVEIKSLYNRQGRLHNGLLQESERFFGAVQSICQSLVGGLNIENTHAAMCGKFGDDHPEIFDLWMENRLEVRDFMEVPTK